MDLFQNQGYLWTTHDSGMTRKIQARWKVKNIGGASDFRSTFILQSRNIGGAKRYPLPHFKKYWGCYSTPSSTGPEDIFLS